MTQKNKIYPASFSLPGSHLRLRKARASYNKIFKPYMWASPFIEVILSRGKTAKISVCDYDRVKRYSHWCVESGGRTFYAVSSGFHRVKMHQLIMGFPEYPKYEVDHINGDGLDNRRENLRVVTHKENMRNLPCHRIKSPGAAGKPRNNFDSKIVFGDYDRDSRVLGSQEVLTKKRRD